MTNPLRRFATRLARALYQRDEPRDYERAIRGHRATARVVKLLGLGIAVFILFRTPEALRTTARAVYALMYFLGGFAIGNGLEARATRYEVQRIEKTLGHQADRIEGFEEMSKEERIDAVRGLSEEQEDEP